MSLARGLLQFTLSRFAYKIKGERMRSEIVAMLIPEGSPGAALLVRRGDGQFLLERIDTRVAAAARVASRWPRKGSAHAAPSGAAHMVEMV